MGKMSRDKGAGFEREVVRLATDYGLAAQRVPLSGATSYAKGDVEITPSFANDPWTFECKRRRELPGWLLDALGDNAGLILRADRHEAVAVVPLQSLLTLLAETGTRGGPIVPTDRTPSTPNVPKDGTPGTPVVPSNGTSITRF